LKKAFVVLLLIVAGVGAFLYFPRGASTSTQNSATLAILNTAIEGARAGAAFAPALDGELYATGDLVRANVDGRAVLTFFDGSSLSVDPGSQVKVVALNRVATDGIQVTIEQTLELSRTGALPGFAALGILVMALVVIVIIVFFERAQRRLLIQYPKRQVGNKMFQGDTSHLPLKVNTGGVIPVIFGSSLLLLPATITSFAAQGGAPTWLTYTAALLGRGQPLYLVLYGVLIVFFSFFYTAIVLNPEETADNLKRSGGFIPGIRPGERTAQHIDYVVTRITVVGAIYLTVVALIPEMLHSELNISQYIGGTSLIILVTVTLDTISQIQSHLIAQQYEGLVKRARLGGRRR